MFIVPHSSNMPHHQRESLASFIHEGTEKGRDQSLKKLSTFTYGIVLQEKLHIECFIKRTVSEYTLIKHKNRSNSPVLMLFNT